MLALPEFEWERDDEYLIDDACKRRGIGLLLVSGIQRLRVAEEIQPTYTWRDCMRYYPKAEEYWYV